MQPKHDSRNIINSKAQHDIHAARQTVNLEDLFVGVSGIARVLIISRSKVYRMLRSGDLINPHVVIGRSPRWLKAELADWVMAGCPRREVWRWDGHPAKAKLVH